MHTDLIYVGSESPLNYLGLNIYTFTALMSTILSHINFIIAKHYFFLAITDATDLKDT